MGPNNMTTMDDLDLPLANSTIPDISNITFSIEENKWANHPDPRYQYSELKEEDVVMEGLHGYFTYHFSIFMSNAAGDSDLVESPLIQLPGTGTQLHELGARVVSVVPPR